MKYDLLNDLIKPITLLVIIISLIFAVILADGVSAWQDVSLFNPKTIFQSPDSLQDSYESYYDSYTLQKSANHEGDTWQDAPNRERLESRHFSVTLPDSVDSSHLARRIAGSWKWWQKFDLADELDKLYREVLEKTDLHRTTPEKIKIEFKNSSEIPSALPAVYLHEKKIIYVITEKADREVIVHEMAHAALHAYTGVKLPHKIDEVLALWVTEKFV